MFRRLHPDPASGLDAAEVTRGLRLSELAPPDRPYVVLNMAATADGRVAIGGRSAPVAGRADRELFHELRAQADAVMAGAATARVERYRPLIKTDELRARRAEAGVAENPLAVFVSGALDLPDDLPILQDPESRVAIVTRSDRRFEGARAEVTYLVQAPGSAELAPALSTLRTEHGVRSILCEGGPHLNDSLLREGLVDELFLCVSPKLAGDSSQPAAVEGTALPAAVDMELLSLHEADGHVFFRYRVSR